MLYDSLDGKLMKLDDDVDGVRVRSGVRGPAFGFARDGRDRGALIEIRDAASADWPDIEGIYRQGIQTGNATFEENAPGWSGWDQRHLSTPRLIAKRQGRTIGWAAISPVSFRSVYRGVAEVSVYVATAEAGRGVGTLLLRSLAAASEAAGIWTLQASIFPENAASLRIHEKCGFRLVGRRERVGFHRGRWRDVLLLERRSAAV